MAFFTRKQARALPDYPDAESYVHAAASEDDPVFCLRLLDRAEALAPDSLPVQRAKLMLGRLYERDPGKIDFSVIKCYMLHVFEYPDRHQESDIRLKTREVFDHPQLQRCLALAADPDAFLRGYLEDISLEYIRVFLASSASHMPSVLGFTLRHSPAHYLAAPMAQIIANMLSSAYLRANEQQLLAGMFYRACHRYLNGDTRHLDAALGPETMRALR